MGLLEDIMKALDRIPNWKRVQELPTEVDALKQRVAGLEQKLSGKWPADVCKFCGERAVRMSGTRGPNSHTHISEQIWTCEKCGRKETRIIKP